MFSMGSTPGHLAGKAPAAPNGLIMQIPSGVSCTAWCTAIIYGYILSTVSTIVSRIGFSSSNS